MSKSASPMSRRGKQSEVPAPRMRTQSQPPKASRPPKAPSAAVSIAELEEVLAPAPLCAPVEAPGALGEAAADRAHALAIQTGCLDYLLPGGPSGPPVAQAGGTGGVELPGTGRGEAIVTSQQLSTIPALRAELDKGCAQHLRDSGISSPAELIVWGARMGLFPPQRIEFRQAGKQHIQLSGGPSGAAAPAPGGIIATIVEMALRPEGVTLAEFVARFPGRPSVAQTYKVQVGSRLAHDRGDQYRIVKLAEPDRGDVVRLIRK